MEVSMAINTFGAKFHSSHIRNTKNMSKTFKTVIARYFITIKFHWDFMKVFYVQQKILPYYMPILYGPYSLLGCNHQQAIEQRMVLRKDTFIPFDVLQVLTNSITQSTHPIQSIENSIH